MLKGMSLARKQHIQNKTLLFKRLLAKAELFTEDIQEDKKKEYEKKKDNKEDIAIIISDEETCEVKRSKL